LIWEVYILDTIVGQFILQAALVLICAVFVCAEAAVISINDAKLDKLAAEKNKKAIKLKRLTEHPNKFLSTIQVVITVSGFLAAAFAADSFSGYIVSFMARLGVDEYISEKGMHTIAVVIVTVILSCVMLVIGELVPRKLAAKKSDKLALRYAGLLSFASALFSPIVWLLTVATNCILKLFGIDPNEEDDEVTEEEIRMMVDAGTEKGTIDSDEKEFIQNVFEFDDTDVGEICTHRKEVEILWLEDDMGVWNETINNSRHTKFPVCRESADDVVGILDVKSYFRTADKSRKNAMDNCVEEPQFVLETMKADVMFEKMKNSRNYFAVVLDEYGGMCGIVTLNDLVQQIMGEFLNEGEEDLGEDIEKLDEATWRIMGEASIKDVCEELEVSIPDDEYDTFGGFIFGCLGSIPDDGSKFELEANGMRISVEDVKNHCVVNARVSLLGEEAAVASVEE
jgi:putative hemolysin